MNFDIKDMKSWANRHDVKIGDKGYFADTIFLLNDRVSTGAVRTIKEIDDKKAECFITQNSVDFGFFYH